MRSSFALLALFALACGGRAVPASSPSEPWIDEAVAEALSWEIMPGTEAEEDDGTRAAALRAFFAAHPEYADPAKREALGRHGCGPDLTEGAHAFLNSRTPKETVYVDAPGTGWGLVAAYADVLCTSDDWTWFTAEVNQAASERGFLTTYADAKAGTIVVREGGKEVGRAVLEGQGYVLMKAGARPVLVGHDTPDTVIEAMDGYFKK
jgi:hypothetical protein